MNALYSEASIMKMEKNSSMTFILRLSLSKFRVTPGLLPLFVCLKKKKKDFASLLSIPCSSPVLKSIRVERAPFRLLGAPIQMLETSQRWYFGRIQPIVGGCILFILNHFLAYFFSSIVIFSTMVKLNQVTILESNLISPYFCANKKKSDVLLKYSKMFELSLSFDEEKGGRMLKNSFESSFSWCGNQTHIVAFLPDEKSEK